MSTRTDQKIVSLLLDRIVVDAEHLQPRVKIDMGHQQTLSDAYSDYYLTDDPDRRLPPPVHVFRIKGKNYLVDGFHRFGAKWAIRHLGKGEDFTHIRAVVHEGTWDDAVTFAALANVSNGESKNMDKFDRKKAFMLFMSAPANRELSAALIAKKIGISRSAARLYYHEYCNNNNIDVKDVGIRSDGRLHPRTSSRNGKIRESKGGNASGSFVASVGGVRLQFGRDRYGAEEKKNKYIRQRNNYSDSSKCRDRLTIIGCTCETFDVVLVRQGLLAASARSRGGVRFAFSWSPLYEKADLMRCIGSVLYAKKCIDAEYAVILCPEDRHSIEAIEIGLKVGVRLMTIEQFVEFVAGKDS